MKQESRRREALRSWLRVRSTERRLDEETHRSLDKAPDNGMTYPNDRSMGD